MPHLAFTVFAGDYNKFEGYRKRLYGWEQGALKWLPICPNVATGLWQLGSHRVQQSARSGHRESTSLPGLSIGQSTFWNGNGRWAGRLWEAILLATAPERV